MANKRQKKKQLRKRTVQEIRAIYPGAKTRGKTIDQLTRSLDTTYDLSARGFDLDGLSYDDILKATETGYKSILYGSDIDTFDFYRIYTLKAGMVLQIAYRDYASERDLAEIMQEFTHMSTDSLLDTIIRLNNTRPSYSKSENQDSNGRAGDYKLLCGSPAAAKINHMDTYEHDRNIRRRKKGIKIHGDAYKGYQFLRDGNKTYTDKVTPRALLEVTAAIMSNITEWNRVTFYERMYIDVISTHIPELARLLPYPKNI